MTSTLEAIWPRMLAAGALGLITGLLLLIVRRATGMDREALRQLLTFNPADFFTCAPYFAPFVREVSAAFGWTSLYIVVLHPQSANRIMHVGSRMFLCIFAGTSCRPSSSTRA